MAEIQSLDENAPSDEVMDALERDGAAIYRELLYADTMDRARGDLDTCIERSCCGEGEF